MFHDHAHRQQRGAGASTASLGVTASQENLDQRLALADPQDELKELADTFDAMLARLDAAFASQRRFVANASHELRTPIAADRVPELLEPFRRLNERAGAGAGSGLGLSIVQSVVSAHGGQLSARARPEGGLEIEVTLPAAAGLPAATGEVPASAT